MKEFIIDNNLSNEELNNIHLFIEKISKYKDLNSYAFGGYPYFEGTKENSILKCAIINERGINILVRDADELKRYKRYLTTLNTYYYNACLQKAGFYFFAIIMYNWYYTVPKGVIWIKML